MNHIKPRLTAQLLLATVACLMATPLVWMVLTSLKSQAELTADPHRVLPESWQWGNYREAVESMPYAIYLRNSILLCAGSVAGTVLSCSLVAYGFARLTFRGRNLLFGVMIATMLLPWHVTMIPRFLLLRELGLYNSLSALVLPTFLADAFYIFPSWTMPSLASAEKM